MSDGEPDRDDFLSRWSRRKSAARAGAMQEPEAKELPAAALPATSVPSVPEARPAEPLPPVETLTPESDFTPFMRSDVDPSVRRQALRTLFRDPRFNEMDGLDTYIGDYSQPDPIPPEWLGQLNQMARLGEYQPPKAEEEPANGGEPDAPGQIAQVEQGLDGSPVEEPPDDCAAGSRPPELKQS